MEQITLTMLRIRRVSMTRAVQKQTVTMGILVVNIAIPVRTTPPCYNRSFQRVAAFVVAGEKELESFFHTLHLFQVMGIPETLIFGQPCRKFFVSAVVLPNTVGFCSAALSAHLR